MHNKPGSARETRRLVEIRIRPEFGKRKVAEITPADLSRLHRGMKATPYQANRVLAVLSTMFNLAETWGLRSEHSNPCRLLQRYKESARERFHSASELRQLGLALVAVEREALAPAAPLAAIRFLALTGCRRSEALGLTWEATDLTTGIARIIDAKAGDRALVLSAPSLVAWRGGDDAVVALLDGRRNEAGRFPNLQTVRTAAETQDLELPPGFDDVRLHDLRHTVGTFAGQAGANAFLVRDLLGHKSLAMTGRYVGRDVDPHRALADSVAGRIEAAMAGREGEVIELPKRQ